MSKKLRGLPTIFVAVIAVLMMAATVAPVQAAPPSSRPGSRGHALALPCEAANVTTSLTWQTSSGALLGKLTYVNRSSSSCSLVGRPTILLLANGTQILPVVITLPVSTITHFAIGSIIPVTLAPRDTAVVSVKWYNWCGARPRTLSLIYALPAGGGGYALAMDSTAHNAGALVPHCDNQVLPSHLDVGLFQRP